MRAPSVKLTLNLKRNITGYIFVLPALIAFAIFVVIPLVISVVISLYETDKFFIDMKFIGLKNFQYLLKDPIFGKSLINILLYAIMAVASNIVISLAFAYLVNMPKKGRNVYKVIFYLPAVTSSVAASLVWMWLMNPVNGLLNKILETVGLPKSTWLSHSRTALVSVVIVTVWQGLGQNMIIFLAALQGLPEEIYEAARIDGASKFVTFRKLTIPFLSPTIFFVVTMTLIGAFQLYDQVFVLTAGGPANSTITPVYLIWQNAFGNAVRQAGYASAQSFMLFLIIMATTFLFRLIMRKAEI